MQNYLEKSQWWSLCNKTAVPYGMTGLVAKLQSLSCRLWYVLALSVKEHFQLEEKVNISAKNFAVGVSFSGKNAACVFFFELLTLLQYRWNGKDIDILWVALYMHNLSCIKIQHVAIIISCFSEFPKSVVLFCYNVFLF